MSIFALLALCVAALFVVWTVTGGFLHLVTWCLTHFGGH